MPRDTHCRNCGKPLPPPPPTGGRRYFCDVHCKRAASNGYRRSRRLAEQAIKGNGLCPICGTQLTGKKSYCSRVCQRQGALAGRRVANERTFPATVELACGAVVRIEVDEVERDGQRERLPRPVWEFQHRRKRAES